MSELARSSDATQLLAPIDFYFDLGSPYAYLGSELIDALGARYRRQVNWHVFLLGAAFKHTGAAPLTQQALKGSYALHDFVRSASFHDIPYRQPARFPVSTVHAARAFCWLSAQEPLLARGFAHAVFRAYFTADRDIDNIETVLDIAQSQGIARSALAEALGSVALKDMLRLEVDRAIARGVFGAPFFILDGEAFWGVDRLPQLTRRLDGEAF